MAVLGAKPLVISISQYLKYKDGSTMQLDRLLKYNWSIDPLSRSLEEIEFGIVIF
jgi:hypothetical protein